MAEKLSVTIITLNEEANISRCLESLRWADEIVVMDSGSSDRTLESCGGFPSVRVVRESWHGYGRQKNLCAGQASHRWILNVDADEVVTPESAEEIRKILAEEPRHPLYSLPRKNHVGGRWVRHGGWYPDRILRLYDKTRVRFSEPLVHERLTPDADAGELTHPILHYSYRDMEDYVARQNHYSTLQAREMQKQGRSATLCDMALRPLAAFAKQYILKQGFMDGYLGLFLAVSSAHYTYLKYAKARREHDVSIISD